MEGPREIVGEDPYGTTGGVGAVWLKAREAGYCPADGAPTDPGLTKRVEIRLRSMPPETL